ncbi:MAG TPA: hypothetical protein VJT83_03955, partial [Chitinophagaceae bacterium]|nr:hypothetical protein [Chitinophagaceae bacterium]
MNWKIFLITLGISAGCTKSQTEEQQIVSAQKTIVGKWELVQYYRENQDGTGQWVPRDTGNIQVVKFTEDGGITYNENFVVPKGINRYKFLEPHKVLLYSTTTSDSAKYFFQQDNANELIFNPLCMEFSCMR